jgi:hypothetical protein
MLLARLIARLLLPHSFPSLASLLPCPSLFFEKKNKKNKKLMKAYLHHQL